MRACANGLIDSYLRMTSGLESPELFHMWSIISVVAATLGRSCHLDLIYFKFFPNMYVVVVGPSGIRKSTATRFAMGCLREADVGKEILEGKLTIQYVIQRMGEIYALNGVSEVFIHAEEFKVFASPANINSSLLEDMTSLWDCPEHLDYRTRTGGKYEVNKACLNLLAASVPEWLTVTSGADFINSGFSGRVIYVWRDVQERRFSIPRPPANYDKLRADVVHDLREIAKLQGAYRLSDDAFKFQDDWYMTPSIFIPKDERLHAYTERKQAHMLKLAMVLKACEDDDMIVQKCHVERAIALQEQLEKDMHHAYNAVSFHEAGVQMERIEAQLLKSPGHFMTYSQLMKLNKHRMSDQMLDQCLNTLIAMETVIRTIETRGTKRVQGFKLNSPSTNPT